MQRVGWAVLAIALALGVLGLVGSGLFTNTTAGDPGGFWLPTLASCVSSPPW